MSDINHYNLSDITDYVICPYSTILKKEESSEEALNGIYKEVATFYFSKKLLEKNVTYQKLYKHFNVVWGATKHKVSKNMSISAITALSKPVGFIHNLLEPNDEVIVSQYESFVELTKSIVHNKIDAITYNNKTKEVKLILVLDKSDVSANSPDITYIKAYLTLVAKQSAFLKQRNNVKIIIVIPKYSISIIDNVSSNIDQSKNLLEGPIKGIVSKNFYPIPSKINCQKCLCQKTCLWRNK